MKVSISSSYKLAKEIIKEFNADESTQDTLYENLTLPLKNVKEDANISAVKVPIIFYRGPKETLPTIFENINSKGTKLNKYQIFAATWQDEIEILDTDIVNLIQQKYQVLTEEGYQIENYDEDKFSEGPFTVFEYIFGLGKFLSIRYPYFFGESESDSADSIGFNLTAICLNLRISDLSKLPETIKKVVKVHGNIKPFQDALIQSTDFVFKVLKPFITLRANKKKLAGGPSKHRIYHTEYQLISLIAEVFHTRFDDNFDQKKTWKESRKILQKTLPQHFLFDIVRDVWRGSGDTRITEVLESSDYQKVIPRQRWETTLKEWFNEKQLSRREQRRVNIRDTDYLFLNYIYAHKLTYNDVESVDEYHIEHIVPIEKLRNISEDGVPISAVSNLCLLPEELNKEKKSLTIYEFYDKQIATKEMTEQEVKDEIEKVEKFSWTTRKSLEFTGNLTPENYVQFISERFEKLQELFFQENRID